MDKENNMGSKYRKLYTRFWDDPDIEELFDKEDRLFYIFLLTNPHSTQWGVYELTVKYASNKTGFTPDEIRQLLDKFENVYHKIVYSYKYHEICICNALKWNIEGSNPSVIQHIRKGLEEVHDETLLGCIVDYEQLLIEKPSKKKTQNYDIDVNFDIVPPTLFKLKGFMEQWNKFIVYRKQDKKKPISVMQAEALLLDILTHYEGGDCDPTETLKRSIANGWQGIFYDNGELARRRRPKRISEAADGEQAEGTIV
jgi:hypothetical protein